MPDPLLTGHSRLHRWMFRLLPLGGAVTLAAFTFAGVSLVQHSSEQDQINQLVQQNNAVLCVFRHDLRERADVASLKLAQPDLFGLTPSAVAALRITSAGQQATLASLKGLKCGA